MKNVSPGTKAILIAHGRMLNTFEKARSKHAMIPLMHKEIDPRTHAKHEEAKRHVEHFMHTGELPPHLRSGVVTDNAEQGPRSTTPQDSRATEQQTLSRMPQNKKGGVPMQPDQVGVGGYGSIETGYSVGNDY